jgi:hypothetical protein
MATSDLHCSILTNRPLVCCALCALCHACGDFRCAVGIRAAVTCQHQFGLREKTVSKVGRGPCGRVCYSFAVLP